MPVSRSLLVLKFGGSVLADSAAIPAAAREVARLIGPDGRAVVVVSAFKHRTDALERAARSLCPAPSPDALAFFMGLGDMQSAAELTLALQGAGIPATLRLPADVWFFSSGSPLDCHAGCGFAASALDGWPCWMGICFSGVGVWIVVASSAKQDWGLRTED